MWDTFGLEEQTVWKSRELPVLPKKRMWQILSVGCHSTILLFFLSLTARWKQSYTTAHQAVDIVSIHQAVFAQTLTDPRFRVMSGIILLSVALPLLLLLFPSVSSRFPPKLPIRFHTTIGSAAAWNFRSKLLDQVHRVSTACARKCAPTCTHLPYPDEASSWKDRARRSVVSSGGSNRPSVLAS